MLRNTVAIVRTKGTEDGGSPCSASFGIPAAAFVRRERTLVRAGELLGEAESQEPLGRQLALRGGQLRRKVADLRGGFGRLRSELVIQLTNLGFRV